METPHLFGIPNLDMYIVLGVLIFFGLIEVIAGYLNTTKRNRGDWIQEAGSFFLLAVVTKPVIVLSIFFIGDLAFPNGHHFFANWSMWLLLPFYLLIDDLLQYWYHRSAHEYEWLWKLHRPHHQAEEMGFFISYRNAALYYLLMPNIWWIAIITFFGGGIAVAIGLILKQLVVISSHSTIKWDSFFYKRQWLSPIMTVLERIFITPAFHYGHHGKSMKDGISDPNGNYGNTFSFWDQIFGTAKFTRQYPTELGLENDTHDNWVPSFLYPFVKSDIKESEISKGFIKETTSTNLPISVRLEKGEKYLWCKCGKSKNQPFCDGSHHGSRNKPLLFEVKKSGDFRLCNCKITKVGPFCDDSHLKS